MRALLGAVALLTGWHAAAVADQPLPATAPLPACPTIAATLDATIDTKKVKAGEIFRFTTLDAGAYNNAPIPAGTPGVGLIATLDHSKSQGHSGYLVLEARYLAPSGGAHVPVALVPAGDGRAQAFVRAGSSDAGFISYLPYYIGTAAGVYNVFHHGKDAAVLRGTRLTLIVGDEFFAGECALAIDQK